jgi:23S rRNA pseudouridine1911/1915/1917 synthase
MKRSTGKEQQRPWRLPFGLEILYEDDDIMVVFKPEGLLSVSAAGEKDRTAYWILNEYLRRRGTRQQVAVVHRLDRDTSGVMVFAKSAAMKKALMDNWGQPCGHPFLCGGGRRLYLRTGGYY